MNIAIVFGVILVLLFALAFVTKRRFGVLGLALGAGSILSSLWAQTLTPMVEHAGVVVNQPPMITVVSVALVLLPAIILFLGGPKYHGLVPRLLGAFCFAALALALLIQPLGSAFVLHGNSQQIYDFFVTNRVYIVTIGLILAVGDLLGTQNGRTHHHDKH